MSQPLPYGEIEMWHGDRDLSMIKIGDILKFPDDSDIGYFIEVDLRYPDIKKEKTKNFPICPENEIRNKNRYNAYMKTIQPKNYKITKK